MQKPCQPLVAPTAAAAVVAVRTMRTTASTTTVSTTKITTTPTPVIMTDTRRSTIPAIDEKQSAVTMRTTATTKRTTPGITTTAAQPVKLLAVTAPPALNATAAPTHRQKDPIDLSNIKNWTSTSWLRYYRWVAPQARREDRPHLAYQCLLCEGWYRDESDTRRHLSSAAHFDYRPFPCALCSFSFHTRSKWLIHQRVHTRDKPFRCMHCNKEFPYAGGLAEHIKDVHNKHQRRFECTVCFQAFPRAAGLARHQLKHDNTREFECDQCHARFRRIQHLEKHLATASNKACKNYVKRQDRPWKRQKIDIDEAKNTTDVTTDVDGLFSEVTEDATELALRQSSATINNQDSYIPVVSLPTGRTKMTAPKRARLESQYGQVTRTYPVTHTPSNATHD